MHRSESTALEILFWQVYRNHRRKSESRGLNPRPNGALVLTEQTSGRPTRTTGRGRSKQASLCSRDCSGSAYVSPENITERLWLSKMGRVACETVRVSWYVALEAYTRAGREDRQARPGFPRPQTAPSSILAPCFLPSRLSLLLASPGN